MIVLFISLVILISTIVFMIDLKNRVMKLGLKTMEDMLKDQKFSDKGKIEDILKEIDNEENIKTINKEINIMLKEIKEDLQNLRKQAINNDNL